MTKREEIEEGLKAFLQGVAHNGYYDGLEVRLLEELDSEGCVIKVAGKLPDRKWFNDFGGESGEKGYQTCYEDVMNAGGGFFESLIDSRA